MQNALREFRPWGKAAVIGFIGLLFAAGNLPANWVSRAIYCIFLLFGLYFIGMRHWVQQRIESLNINPKFATVCARALYVFYVGLAGFLVTGLRWFTT